jgi:hypothetical protein
MTQTISWRNKLLIPIYWYVLIVGAVNHILTVWCQAHQLGFRSRYQQVLKDKRIYARETAIDIKQSYTRCNA